MIPRIQDIQNEHYRIGLTSGAITGTDVDAAEPLFSARWTNTAYRAVITRLSAKMTVTTAFTGVQRLGLDLIFARSWTVADSGGTAITLAENAQKTRTKWTDSKFVTEAGIRIADTTSLTAGTRTLDSNPLMASAGVSHDPNVAAATAQIIATPQIGFDFVTDLSGMETPLVLTANEGVIVRNTVDFPAAGVIFLVVNMAWIEVPIANF